MFQTNTIIKYVKTAVRKLFKMANKIISISNSISNQPVMHVSMDASNITQSHTKYNVIKTVKQYKSI